MHRLEKIVLYEDLQTLTGNLIKRYGVWLLRVAVFWLVISNVRPATPRAILGEPQTVQSQHEHICVHTRLIDEVEEWVMQRTLQLVREMGADTIVEFFPWAYIELTPGRYDWAQADRIVRQANNQGIRIIARMGFVPEWARPDEPDTPTTLNTLPPERYDDFARFVADFAARYAGTIDQLIIWNEPNLAFEWGYASVDPVAYVDLLQAVHAPVKAANPDVMILAGALAPTLEPVNSPNGLNDVLYLEAMYQAGAADYFDALAVHTYGFTKPPADSPAFDVLNFRRAELLHDLVRQYDDPGTPMFVTETGWNDHPRWALSVRPAQRIQYTVDAFRYAQTNWPHVRELCLWVFRYPVPTLSYPDNYTLVTTDFQRKPIYETLRAYARGLEGGDDLWLTPPAE